MEFEAIWNGETEQRPLAARRVLDGRRTGARWRGRLCLACGERRAVFSYRGVVKADRHHTLCFACYRAEANRLRARLLSAAPAGVAPVEAGLRPSKTFGDRAALLADLGARRRRAQILARRALEASERASSETALVS